MLNRKNGVYFFILLPLVGFSLFHFVLASYHTLLIGFADIDVFIYSVLNYLHTGFLYQDREPLALTYEAGRSVLKFPPLYVVPYLPWLHHGTTAQNSIDPHIYKELFALHIIRYIASFFLLGFFVGPAKNPLWWMLLMIVFGLCAPFYEALYGLTFDNLYLFILVLALLLIKYQQKFATASVLMYAANAKLYPVIQILPFLVSRNWKMLMYCVLATLAWLATSLYFFSFSQHQFFYMKVLPVLLQEDVLCETGNLSLAAQLCQHAYLVKIMKALFIGASVVVAYLAVNNKNTSFEKESLLFSFIICLPLLLMQNVWGNYQMVLLVPVSVLVAYAFNHTGFLNRMAGFIALLACLPLLVSDNYPVMNLPYYAFVNEHLARFMIDSLKPFIVLVLWMLLAGLLLFRQKL